MLVYTLTSHPEFPPRAVTGVLCWIRFFSAGQWELQFGVECPVGQLLVPAAKVSQRADGLWRETCFELFVLDPATSAYLEFNMSPSGCWAAYSFDGYRQGMGELDVPGITIKTTDAAEYRRSMQTRMLALGVPEEAVDEMLKVAEVGPSERQSVCFDLAGVLDAPSLEFAPNCRVGISAVIEETDGTKSYWALAHPPGKPDFHHPACFAAMLPPPNET